MLVLYNYIQPEQTALSADLFHFFIGRFPM